MFDYEVYILGIIKLNHIKNIYLLKLHNVPHFIFMKLCDF